MAKKFVVPRDFHTFMKITVTEGLLYLCQKVHFFSRHGLYISPEKFHIDFHQNRIIFSTSAAIFHFSQMLLHKIAQNLKWPHLSRLWSEWTEILHGCSP